MAVNLHFVGKGMKWWCSWLIYEKVWSVCTPLLALVLSAFPLICTNLSKPRKKHTFSWWKLDDMTNDILGKIGCLLWRAITCPDRHLLQLSGHVNHLNCRLRKDTRISIKSSLTPILNQSVHWNRYLLSNKKHPVLLNSMHCSWPVQPLTQWAAKLALKVEKASKKACRYSNWEYPWQEAVISQALHHRLKAHCLNKAAHTTFNCVCISSN